MAPQVDCLQKEVSPVSGPELINFDAVPSLIGADELALKVEEQVWITWNGPNTPTP